MSKVVVGLLLTTVAACVFHAVGADAGGDVDWHAMLAEAKSREAEIDANNHQRSLLAVEMERILARFEHGSINLVQTVEALETEAAATYPDYLSFIHLLENGETLEEKLGYNVVRHFHQRHRLLKTSESLHVMERAEAELRSMLGHELIDMEHVQ
jgi:hypothetical protein